MPKTSKKLLTTAQARRLKQISETAANKGIRRRAEMLLLSDQGLTTREIGEQLNVSMNTVFRWRRAFREEGMAIFPDDKTMQAPPKPAAAASSTRQIKKTRTRRPKQAEEPADAPVTTPSSNGKAEAETEEQAEEMPSYQEEIARLKKKRKKIKKKLKKQSLGKKKTKKLKARAKKLKKKIKKLEKASG